MWLCRILPAAVGMAFFLVFSALWLTDRHPTYETILLALGVEPFRFPFVDAHAVLSAIEVTDLELTSMHSIRVTYWGAPMFIRRFGFTWIYFPLSLHGQRPSV
jgi:hypothetical protein